jgi:hypothetical protein
MPKKGVVQSSTIDYNSHSKRSWLSKLKDLESDSDDEPVLMPLFKNDSPPESGLREWNQKDIPKVLPYHKHVPKAAAPVTKADTWTSIIRTSITPPHELAVPEPHEITYSETIDEASVWSNRIISAFENASTSKKSELSEDFKENLGKLSFFRRPLVPKQ